MGAISLKMVAKSTKKRQYEILYFHTCKVSKYLEMNYYRILGKFYKIFVLDLV